MLKRQDSPLSSSHRETTPTLENHHAKAVGCMSGIFQFISKHQNRNKLLTFGRKHEKKAVSSPSKPNVPVAAHESSSLKEENNVQTISCERLSNDMVPRSPVISHNIRRPNAVNLSEQLRTPPGLIAQLMGLEEEPAAVRYIMAEEEEASIEEKRQRLLQALEKCNEDLEALKEIIKAVQSGENHLQPLPLMNGNKAVRGKNTGIKRCVDKKNEELSPVCVLEELSPAPLRRTNYSKSHTNGVMPQQCKKMPRKKPGEDDDGIDVCFFNRMLKESFRVKRKDIVPSLWGSKTMIQSVDEVCDDIIWGEKRELGNIGLTLQNHICRDLIEEIVKELGYQNVHRLPFEACRRRLSF